MKKSYLVLFHDEADERLIEYLGGEIVNSYKSLKRIVAIKASEEVAETIRNHPAVQSIEEDAEDEFDSIRPQQESYAITDLKVRDFWERGITGRGVKIALFDGGCQRHEDLKIAGGYNAYDPTQTYLSDYRDHGTHVTGIINMQDNDIGYVGIAPDAEVYIVKLDDNKGGGLSRTAQIAAIEWTVQNGIDIVSMSVSGETDSTARSEAFRQAVEEHDIIIVCSAGNRQRGLDPYINTIGYPAKHPFTIACANIDADKRRYESSSCGKELDFSAYGVSIPSTCPDPHNFISKVYCNKTGTSMSTPYVAGMFALYKQLFPDYTRLQLYDKMRGNAEPLGDHTEYGHGLVRPPQELYQIGEPPAGAIHIKSQPTRGYPLVYDLDLKPVAVLENVSKIGYTKKANELWTAHFTLPADDPKNEDCQPFFFVEIFDHDERVDLFRIVPTKRVVSANDRTVTYELEHVLATLIDDVLFQYHQIGGLGVYTDEIIEYILSHQTTQRWQLGRVDFQRQFEYKWENENLLAALFSVANLFAEPYLWSWDTTVYPWTLNLVKPSDRVEAYVRYGKNLRGITKDVDPTQLCTRLYCLGYGEGVNQLGIERVNPTGKPYIDSDTINKYGVVQRIWVDRRFEDERSLFESGQAMLEGLKEPVISYQIDAADISRITEDEIDKFDVGKVVEVHDDEDGVIKNRIVSVSKPDIYGDPGDVQIEIQNPAADIAGSISELADRQRINDTYAQGATNLIPLNFADNCDPDHPAVMRFRIPQEMVRINKVLLSYRAEAFRGYSKATKGGGSIVTSTKGGGGVVTSTKSGGGSTQTSSSGGGGTVTSAAGGGATETSDQYCEGDECIQATLEADGTVGNHFHVLPHQLLTHTHRVSIPSHRHNVTIPNHRHDVTIPAHTHEVDLPDHTHEIELPDHTHEIEHGIFEGPSPSKVTVKVDGNTVPVTSTSADEIDLTPYLEKDNSGRIQRGRWAEIEIIPDDLGRIVADVYVQMFVQSRGGGDY